MKYKCLVIDPPWPTRKTGKRLSRPNQGAELPYATMSGQEILRLPVTEWADEQAYLWLWATNGKDRQTGQPVLELAFSALRAWGFQFHTLITWDKATGVCPYSPYQVTSEYALFAYRGKGVWPEGCMGKFQTVFQAPVRGHSVKPGEFYARIAEYFPGPRLDVFARQVRPGFDGWGDQYEGRAAPSRDAGEPQSQHMLLYQHKA